jgi:hypothetical protein
MTYVSLKDAIGEMTPEQLKSDVTIWLSIDEEFHPVETVEFTDGEKEDRLDDNHPVLIVVR